MNSRWHIVLGLAVLFGANLFLLAAILWLTETWLRGVHWIGPVVGEIVFAQIILLGLWLVLGDPKWYWRLGVAAFGALMLVQAFV